MAADVKYQKIIKYLVTAVCTQPLHIGSAGGDREEVLVHPVDGLPFIQASGIAGVLRQYYEAAYGSEQAEKLFGVRRFETGANAADGASKVRFSDGTFCSEKVMLELRPRVKINPQSGVCDAGSIKGTDRQAGHKFNMEYIGAGAAFRFLVYLYDESFQESLEEILSAVHQGAVQFGGQKSNGCGSIRIKYLKRKIFDMSEKADRDEWANEEILPDQEYEDIFSEMKKRKPKMPPVVYEITVTGSTEGELLVKSIAVQDYGENAPDSMNIRNAAKEYIVPGSSLKGAVRSQMEKIADFIGRGSVIQETFGDTGSSAGKGTAGNIVFYDTVVGNREDNDRARIKNRIHIDKFTGGVMHGGLFNEKNVSGRVVFRIVIRNRNDPDSTCGLLLMALRDMAAGIMSVGGGYGVGKGIIDVEHIVIRDCPNAGEAVIAFEEGRGRITDESGIISRCMKAALAKEAAV